MAATPAATIPATSPRSAHSHRHAPPAPTPPGPAPEGSGAADGAGAAGAMEESGARLVDAVAWRRALRTSKAGAMRTCARASRVGEYALSLSRCIMKFKETVWDRACA